MKFKVLTCLVLIDGGLIYAQSYLWPTTASYLLTSSFAEYRSGHFHAGIDIKTWNQEGYPVLAVRPGYIWQVRVSPYGYGKVLYQKLDTGEFAVYAHLSRFADKIQTIVEKEQQRSGKFSISLQFNPGELPVESGEVIAFTGQTGSGSPHLHF
ncbi:MAG: peptidoglycan DD-metalloendopeptidase family protein [candidate division KSB1 bacterium]|nr:peptidoglycan DD-metalloendopeptidase family protein [candidate division KSB1 bacterium]